MELKAKIASLKNELSSIGTVTKGRDTFIAAVHRFMDMEVLTAPLLQELIDRIEVHEVEGKSKDRIQRIVIYYRFVGHLDVPDRIGLEDIIENTRKGVAIRYLPGIVTA